MPPRRDSQTLTAIQARHIALNAQGFAKPRPAKPGATHMLKVAQQLGAVQLDSVNVLTRAHYLPFFSRLGPYSRDTLDKLTNVRHEIIELLAHQASFVCRELEPLLRARVNWHNRDWQITEKRIRAERPGYIETILKQVSEHGPIALRDLLDAGKRERPKTKYAESSLLWWRPSEGKAVLDGLVAAGRLALAGRPTSFDRTYDLRERVIPVCPPVDDDTARRKLVELAALALGVATAKDLSGYFELSAKDTRSAITDLTESGILSPCQVEGWEKPAWRHHKASDRLPRSAGALLGPFDSLTWSRERTRRLFNFDFSFEIYVPAAKRRYGYYVLPFLLDNTLLARVDLKANRQRGVLLVQGSFLESGADKSRVAAELAEELRLLANWLGLSAIEVVSRGNLSSSLKRAIN